MGDTTIGHVRSAFEHSLQAATRAAHEHEKSGESPPITPPPAPPIGNSEAHMGNHLSASMGANRRISHSVHHQAMCNFTSPLPSMTWHMDPQASIFMHFPI
jgi:hypothetical protein